MRIISQDGKCDYPYENSTLFIDYMDGRVIKIVPSTGGCKGTKIATYSTEEKAVKAMEMLREAYIGMPIVMQNVDVSEDMEKEFERLKKCGIMVRAENQPSKVDFINNVVFQFPQDEDVEINNGLE